MIAKIWRYASTTPGFYFATFLLIWLVAWACNGLAKTNFDLDRLRDLAFFVLSKYLADSGLNSPIGKKIEEAAK